MCWQRDKYGRLKRIGLIKEETCNHSLTLRLRTRIIKRMQCNICKYSYNILRKKKEENENNGIELNEHRFITTEGAPFGFFSKQKHLSKLRLHIQDCTRKDCTYPKCAISKYLDVTRRRFFIRITMSIPKGKRHSCATECANQPRRCTHNSYEAFIPIAPWRWNYATRPLSNLKSKKRSANFEWRLKPFRIHQRLYFLYLLRPINSTPFVGFIRENYCRRFVIGHDQNPEYSHRS